MKKNNTPSLTILIYGLSGSGKSTIARQVKNFLEEKKIQSELMDADDYRLVLSPGEPFDEETRNRFRKKLFFISKILNKNNITTVIPMIASDSAIRQYARKELLSLYEIYISTPIETCIERNPKGIYSKVNGNFKKNIVGIDIPFVEPKSPNLVIDTTDLTINESLSKITNNLSNDFSW